MHVPIPWSAAPERLVLCWLCCAAEAGAGLDPLQHQGSFTIPAFK